MIQIKKQYDTILEEVRDKLTSIGNSEFEARSNQPLLQEMFDKIQELRDEMNEAKKRASQEAAKPYLEAIAEIEQKYAFMLKLSS